jgi:uridine kinase
LTRDLREHRKPPTVLVRRGWLLMRQEPRVVAHAVACGCTPMTGDEAFAHVSRIIAGG